MVLEHTQRSIPASIDLDGLERWNGARFARQGVATPPLYLDTELLLFARDISPDADQWRCVYIAFAYELFAGVRPFRYSL